jgi:hypothetical protein
MEKGQRAGSTIRSSSFSSRLKGIVLNQPLAFGWLQLAEAWAFRPVMPATQQILYFVCVSRPS